jgi:hypothetical protein
MINCTQEEKRRSDREKKGKNLDNWKGIEYSWDYCDGYISKWPLSEEGDNMN